MENDRKPYQPVRVVMIGVESGLERFSKDGITTLPPVAKWRNNLTALSHHENLFFIASDDCIAVYQPGFPFQTLRRQPALLIKPELANRNASGYLSQRAGSQDHSINHLMVGELGSQEILLFVTDSGNVEAYYTGAVLEAIKRAPGQYCEGSSSDVLGLRPFFSHWVRQSAWGIDIHKDARMIAVSANVPNSAQPGTSEDASATITVFAFALHAPPPSSESNSNKAESESPDTVEWTMWDPKIHSQHPKRTRNYKIILAGWDGHGNNIPNICFANSPDDEGGIWILSTDITGEMKSWQVWKRTVFRGWNFGTAEGSVRPWMHHHYPGWNVAALDVSCFRPARDNDEFIGSNKAPVYFGYHDPGQSFNISHIVDRHPENSHFHPSNTEADDDDLSSDDDKIHSDAEGDQSEHEELDSMEDIQSPVDLTSFIPETDWDFMSSEHSMSREIESFGRPVEFQVESEDESVLEDDSSDDADDSAEEQPPSPPNRRIQKHIRRLVTLIQNPNAKTPEIAIIHCSDSHVRLLGSPKARFPHIFCASILRQIMPQNIQTHMQGLEFAQMDRLNMLQKIPELGIILIATQTGRVAVCALTRRPDGLLGFRVDCVLPTKKQERRGRRPEFCSLIGMAVAPIQGREMSQVDSADEDEKSNFEDREIDGVRTSFDPNVVVLNHPATPQERHAWKNEKGEPPAMKMEHRPWTKGPSEVPSWQATEISRRYRVMLTYSDMSVLTYEIWRDVEQGERA